MSGWHSEGSKVLCEMAAAYPAPVKHEHRGISRGGQWCTDNDCRCQQYDWKQGPYFQSDRCNEASGSFLRTAR